MQRSEERAARAALVRDTLKASQDTTRVFPLIGALGDSLRAVERRAVQTAQRSDELDRLLKRERVVRDRLQATIGGLKSSAVAETVFVSDGDNVRHATFDLRQAPYTVHAEVALSRAPSPGHLSLSAELDTLASVAAGGLRPPATSIEMRRSRTLRRWMDRDPNDPASTYETGPTDRSRRLASAIHPVPCPRPSATTPGTSDRKLNREKAGATSHQVPEAPGRVAARFTPP
jgi:hypothetical protein